MKKPALKILVIDDNPTTTHLLEKTLKMDGYEVLIAFDGTNGLKLAEKELPTAILLDVMMPDLDGREVARRLKANPVTKDIPIVFLTVTINVKEDKGDRQIVVDGITYRAMAKPMHTRKLLSVLRKEVNRRIHEEKKRLKQKSLQADK